MGTDKVLLAMYNFGFFNELDRKILFNYEEFSQQLQCAYDLGCMSAIAGDDAKSVDDLTEKEILKMIKTKNNEKH